MGTVVTTPYDSTHPSGPAGYLNNSSIPFLTNQPKQASDIGLDPRLMDIINQIGLKQKGNISSAYGQAGNQLKTKKGLVPGSYADERLRATSDLSNQNLQSGLEGVLGGEGYGKYKSQRDFEQNMKLARYTGELNKPSVLEQALSGLSGGAQVGGQGLAMYNNFKKNKNQNMQPYQQESAPDYGYYTNGGSGLNLTGY